jgi:protein-S-isoprenylcysteine O-methyltransferase Ste14
MADPAAEVSRPPTTTTEQDLRTAGQRQINMIWERTQAGIAIIVVAANIVWVFALLFARDVPTTTLSAAGLLSNAFFLVIGFYFGRTNHARIGDDPRASRAGDSRGSLDDR